MRERKREREKEREGEREGEFRKISPRTPRGAGAGRDEVEKRLGPAEVSLCIHDLYIMVRPRRGSLLKAGGKRHTQDEPERGSRSEASLGWQHRPQGGGWMGREEGTDRLGRTD